MVVVQCAASAQLLVLTLSVHGSADLGARQTVSHTVTRQGEWASARRVSGVLCSRMRAVAVSLGRAGTRLFSCSDGLVGPCIAGVPGLTGASFSADGFWLIGVSLIDAAVEIWDARTGAAVTSLPAVRVGARALSVAWVGQDKLHVSSRLCTGPDEGQQALLTALRFA